MHMGLVDEVLFGKEVVTRWPEIVQSWRNIDYVRPDIHPKSPKMLKEKRAGFKTLWNS